MANEQRGGSGNNALLLDLPQAYHVSRTARMVAMHDLKAKFEKLLTEAEDCDLICKLATDVRKRELFSRLASDFRCLARDIEAMIVNRKSEGI